jgi:hypothetical protein
MQISRWCRSYSNPYIRIHNYLLLRLLQAIFKVIDCLCLLHPGPEVRHQAAAAEPAAAVTAGTAVPVETPQAVASRWVVMVSGEPELVEIEVDNIAAATAHMKPAEREFRSDRIPNHPSSGR